MARRLFETLVLIVLTRENYLTFGYSVGSLIWSRNHESFIPIESVSTFQAERQDYLKKSRELETHDFQNEVLKVAYYQQENIINFYDNDTRITGVCGELWNMLSEYLNFTMVVMKVDNNPVEANGLLSMLTRNDIQIIPRMGYYAPAMKNLAFTIPVWSNKHRLYIKPKSNPESTWMLNMFSRRVSHSILLVFVIMSVLGYTMQRMSIELSKDPVVCHSFYDHLFYTFATFCCQGFIPGGLYRRIKIIGFSKTMFAWLLLIIFSSYIISYMTNHKVHLPFEDLSTMFNSTDYNVVVFNKSISREKFKREVEKLGPTDRYKNRINYIQSLRLMYEMGCRGEKKYALFDADDRYHAYGRLQCELVATEKSYFPTWIGAGVSKTFKYRRTLDMGILKLKEFGLTSGLKNRWMGIQGSPVDTSVGNLVNFQQVSMLYTVLCTGMIASIVLLILENVFYHHLASKRRRGS